MTCLGSPLFEYLDTQPGQLSPDGKHFVVIIRKGNIVDNTNDYSLLLFRLPKSDRHAYHRTLFTFKTRSNRPGIDNVRWTNAHTIVFLGAPNNQLQQIYSYDTRTFQLRRLSQHSTDITSFSTTSDSSSLVFLAKPPIRRFFSRSTIAEGFVVDHEPLTDLIAGRSSDQETGIFYPAQVFVQRQDSDAKKVDLSADNPRPDFDLSLSPDGNYAALVGFANTTPESFRQYSDILKIGYPAARYVLINTRTRTSTPLTDAPISPSAFYSHIAWTADSTSAIVAHMYVSATAGNCKLPGSCKSVAAVVQVSVRTGEITQIAEGDDLDVIRIDSSTGRLMLRRRSAVNADLDSLLVYTKSDGTWHLESSEANSGKSIQEVQGMNKGPKLVLVDRKTKAQTVVMELNPQFRHLQFGQVRDITWKATDGHEARGGLYLPPLFAVGTKYPLVIQTHGWNPKKFWIDGESTAGYAAQALAGKGFVVAQTEMDIGDDLGTTREGPRETAVYEGLIDSLDNQGLIDRTRVGLLGWSRTGYGVRHALTFSKYSFAAAVIVDGMDASYNQYLVELSEPGTKIIDTFENIHGAAPFGDGLQVWLRNATGFNLDKVQTPVRLVALGPYSILRNNWEWFVGLRRLGKPVEMLWLPDALHMPVKPSERMAVQQGTVDWFAFWLQHSDDIDPGKRRQYERWHKLQTNDVPVARR